MDLDVVDDATAGLLAAATDVSASTRASYERRWRMWEAFADHHGVLALPANPAHVAAFVVARHEAGVSTSGMAANLSAIGWFHARLEAAGDDVCSPARMVLRSLGSAGTAAVPRAGAAPVAPGRGGRAAVQPGTLFEGDYRPHSPRAGFTTDALDAGAKREHVRTYGGWQNAKSLDSYYRRTNIWGTTNPASHLTRLDD